MNLQPPLLKLITKIKYLPRKQSVTLHYIQHTICHRLTLLIFEMQISMYSNLPFRQDTTKQISIVK